MFGTIFSFLLSNLKSIKGLFSMLSLRIIKTGIIWATIAIISIGGFSYLSLTKENKSLISQMATVVADRQACINNKTMLVLEIDKQNKAVKKLQNKLKVRGQLLKSTKMRNAELLSQLSTRLDDIYKEKKLESCEGAMDWLLDKAVIR